MRREMLSFLAVAGTTMNALPPRDRLAARVDAEVVLVRQLHDHCVGDAAIADLQRRTIADEVSNKFADGYLHRADLRQTHFEHRLAAFGQRCDLRNVRMTVPIGKRDVRGFTSSTTARALATAAIV